MPTAEHTSAIDRWKAGRSAAEILPRHLPLATWVLYRVHFISTSDILGDWETFGGLAAQLNHFAIVLHIATTETVAAGLTYDTLMRARLEELARSRAERSTGTPDFQSLLSPMRLPRRTRLISPLLRRFLSLRRKVLRILS